MYKVQDIITMIVSIIKYLKIKCKENKKYELNTVLFLVSSTVKTKHFDTLNMHSLSNLPAINAQRGHRPRKLWQSRINKCSNFVARGTKGEPLGNMH